MADGFVSLASGECVATIQQASQTLCGGFPQMQFGQYGIEGETTCRIEYEAGNAMAFVTFEHFLYGGYQWGEARQVAITECDQTAGPWSLSTSDGLVVAAAIVGVWILAWGWRVVRAALA